MVSLINELIHKFPNIENLLLDLKEYYLYWNYIYPLILTYIIFKLEENGW